VTSTCILAAVVAAADEHGHPRAVEDDQPPRTALRLIQQGREVGHRPRQAVQLGDDETPAWRAFPIPVQAVSLRGRRLTEL
jgi:hypothetical protein